MAWSQDGKSIQINTILGPDTEGDVLLLNAVDAKEWISRPFSYTCDLLSPARQDKTYPNIRPEDLLHTWATINVQFKHPWFSTTSYIPRSGVIRSFAARGYTTGRGFRIYRTEIVPWLALLDLSTDLRIFQNMSAVEVLEAVFHEETEVKPTRWKRPNLVDLSKLDKQKYPKLEYCVQCRETTLNFVSRLMEENGIFYYIDHRAGSHTLVLGDDNRHLDACQQSIIGLKPVDHLNSPMDGVVDNWEHFYQTGPSAWTVGDFNFAAPAEPIRGKYTFSKSHARYAFPVPSNDTVDANRQARIFEEQEITGPETVSGTSQNCKHFCGGNRFSFFPDGELANEYDFGREYILVEVKWTASEAYEGVTWAGLARILESDLSVQPTVIQSMNNIGQNVTGVAAKQPALQDAQDWTGMLFAWASGGVIANLVQDVLKYLWSSPDPTYNLSFKAVPSTFLQGLPASPIARPFRPARVTPKPEIRGPQLGFVVADPKATAPDICTDQFGRVRVRFAWDRSWPPWDEASSATAKTMTAWLRVSEGWAGDGWGIMFPPRIGQEVIVNFIDGNPDNPIVTGRVYNGAYRPPFYQRGMQPEALPPGAMRPDWVKMQTNMFLSGIETRSAPMPRDAKGNPTGKTGYHLLRFDDSYGDEQLLMRSQGRMDVTAKNSHYDTTEGDRHVLCVAGKDKNGAPVGGSLFTTTGWSQFGNDPAGEYDLHVGGKRREQVELGYQLRVKKDTELDLKGNCIGVVGGTLSLSASEIVLQASKKITLKVSGSTLVLNSAGHYFDGPVIKKQEGGPAGTASGLSNWTIKDAKQADPGEPAISRGAASGGSGGSGGDQSGDAQPAEQPVPPQTAPNWQLDDQRRLSVAFDELAGTGGGAA